MTITAPSAIPARGIRLARGQIEIDALRPRLAGQLITAASADFDAARSVVDFTVDRRPLAIVRASSAQNIPPRP